jgi:thioredoxin reductase (NADPH)
VTSLRLWNNVVTLRHGTGESEEETERDALYSALGVRVHSELTPEAARDDEGYLLTDRHQKTSLDGLFAAGDVAHGLNQISVALGTAAIAAWSIHRALERTE